MNSKSSGLLYGGTCFTTPTSKGVSEDYALQEYGLTKKELSRAAKRMDTESAADKKRGRLRRYSGNIERDLR